MNRIEIMKRAVDHIPEKAKAVKKAFKTVTAAKSHDRRMYLELEVLEPEVIDLYRSVNELLIELGLDASKLR